MTYEYAKLNNDKTQVVQIIHRGQSYKNTSFSINAKDSEYIAQGLLPIKSEFPIYNENFQYITNELIIHRNYVERKYTVHNYTLEELKKNIFKKVRKLSAKYEMTRPRVELILDSGEKIFIDGSRLDKDNFKEKFQLMERFGIEEDYIKDADNRLIKATRADIERAYVNIVLNYSQKMNEKWELENKINSASSITELINLPEIKNLNKGTTL